MPAYQPPFQLTHRMTALVADIAEQLGAWKAANRGALVPELRRGNRIRWLQASLAIEQNTLSVEQVTAVLAGKPVLGSPKEVQEVRNAFTAYEAIEGWQLHRLADLLQEHGLLMDGLVDRPGKLRDGDVGIWRDGKLLHMASPARQMPRLVAIRDSLEEAIQAEVSVEAPVEMSVERRGGRRTRSWSCCGSSQNSRWSRLPRPSVVRCEPWSGRPPSCSPKASSAILAQRRAGAGKRYRGNNEHLLDVGHNLSTATKLVVHGSPEMNNKVGCSQRVGDKVAQ